MFEVCHVTAVAHMKNVSICFKDKSKNESIEKYSIFSWVDIFMYYLFWIQSSITIL